MPKRVCQQKLPRPSTAFGFLMRVMQESPARPILWLICAACCSVLCFLYPQSYPISADFSSYVAALAIVLPSFALLATIVASFFYVSLWRKIWRHRHFSSLWPLAIGSVFFVIALGPVFLFLMGEVLGAMRLHWFTVDTFSLLIFAVIFLVLGSGCGIVIYRPKETLKFVRSGVGILSGVFAVIFAFLPLGCWWSAGTIRWQGGCPFYFITAQGDTPTAWGNWGFTPISWELWYAWYWRLPADWLFWMTVISFSALAAKAISRLAGDNVRWSFVFAVFICILVVAYRYTFGGVWYYILLSYLLS